MSEAKDQLGPRRYWVRVAPKESDPTRLEWQLASKPDLGGPDSLIIHHRADNERECHKHYHKLQDP